MGRQPGDYRKQYVRIADDLRKEIASGRYPVGENLPTTGQLAERYGVAVMTVSGAMSVLRDEGLIKTRQGSPAVVIAVPGAVPDTPDQEHSEEFEILMSAIQEIKGEVSQLRVKLAKLEDERSRGRTDEP